MGIRYGSFPKHRRCNPSVYLHHLRECSEEHKEPGPAITPIMQSKKGLVRCKQLSKMQIWQEVDLRFNFSSRLKVLLESWLHTYPPGLRGSGMEMDSEYQLFFSIGPCDHLGGYVFKYPCLTARELVTLQASMFSETWRI